MKLNDNQLKWLNKKCLNQFGHSFQDIYDVLAKNEEEKKKARAEKKKLKKLQKQIEKYEK